MGYALHKKLYRLRRRCPRLERFLCCLVNIFPTVPRYRNPYRFAPLKRLGRAWCRWIHRPWHRYTNYPEAGQRLRYNFTCERCNRSFSIYRPNTPQSSNQGPWGPPNLDRPKTWHEEEVNAL